MPEETKDSANWNRNTQRLVFLLSQLTEKYVVVIAIAAIIVYIFLTSFLCLTEMKLGKWDMNQ